MAIYRLLQNSPMGPEQISRLSEAYEQTLKALSLKDRNDPLTELIAKKIIEIGQPASKSQRRFPNSRSRASESSRAASVGGLFHTGPFRHPLQHLILEVSTAKKRPQSGGRSGAAIRRMPMGGGHPVVPS